MLKMNKINLYNQDGSLCSEAQFLLSFKSSNMSMGDWKKRTKVLKSQLSVEDIKEFERLKKIVANAKWRAENPEKVKENNTNWKTENPRYYTEWKAENSEHAASYINDYHKQRRAKDPLYRLQQNMRSTCNGIIKRLSLGKKPVSTFKWIGCSPEELKEHLESLFTEGMTWENYGEWHVDHIRPVCSFSAEEWEQVNHYTNLQPLWAEDNYAKISSDLKQKKY